MHRKFSAILAVIIAGITLAGGGNADEANYFKDHSLVLDGLIGVNFYTTYDSAIHHITFTVEGRTDEKASQTVNASDETRNGDSEYKFTCYVAAPEMASTITAVLYDSSGNTLQTQEYSVQQYITEFETERGKYPAYAVNAVEAMADYGHYALEYLAESKRWTKDESGKYNGMFTPINAIHNFTAEDLQAVKDSVSGYEITKDPDSIFQYINIEDAEISLNLDSETSIYFYLMTSEDLLTSLQGFNLSLQSINLSCDLSADNVYRFKSDGIPAHKLDEAQELSLTFPSTNVLVSASPLAYVNAVLNSSAKAFNTDACRNAMIAIYRYYDCAKKYQEGAEEAAFQARLGTYNLEGAKAWSGKTANTLGTSVSFNYKEEGSDTVTGIDASNQTFTLLNYASTTEGSYMAVIWDKGSCIGKVTAYDESTGKYSVTGIVKIAGNTHSNATADIFIASDGKFSTYNTNEVICTLTDATPREALATILRKGYELPQ